MTKYKPNGLEREALAAVVSLTRPQFEREYVSPELVTCIIGHYQDVEDVCLTDLLRDYVGTGLVLSLQVRTPGSFHDVYRANLERTDDLALVLEGIENTWSDEKIKRRCLDAKLNKPSKNN